jgi:hypothetical protein
MRSLSELHIRGGRIDDAAIAKFCNSRTLDVLYLRQTEVTAEGVQWLRRQAPQLRIITM